GWGMETQSKINGLAWTVLAMANSTENALTLISDEMRQLRDAVIQNRLVLDMLTAERGGVCKMLGISCCFNILDYCDNIREPERTDNLWAGWVMSLWGGWMYWIIQTVLPIVMIGMLILFCLP
uniref:Envelope glycoprotein n=1 Tax=Sinocyclocheilus grahami TaxID=75366 RepID=A0A672KRQ6_SINGR